MVKQKHFLLVKCFYVKKTNNLFIYLQLNQIIIVVLLYFIIIYNCRFQLKALQEEVKIP